ncbi:hypothetical protein [Arthrobacter oryzae]|uniref:hypothetical protein n=1 Tax=Arthrobacter oryzae TaxID=409290 RepID=UPI00273C8082|nr:hypothetical protein [Arthrobacter oryzae]WLQ07255.1 hypothetical protein Q8Z05_03625 [Arthrobacter oryzae]
MLIPGAAPGEGLIVDTGGNTIVRTSSELSVGEEIEAWHKGRLFHRGRVTETIPTTDLFWIVDSRTGSRKLLDVEALEIIRVDEVAAVEPARLEPAIRESGRLDKAVRAERVPAPRAARREPHVVWFSNA